MINWRVATFAELDSTQDYLRDLADSGEQEGMVIQALAQTAGRGRHGNTWTSPLGNLYMSVLLRPNCRADIAGQMSFITGLALSAAMDFYLAAGHDKKLKWPNDILIDGKKSAGILIESKVKGAQADYLIVGIGVNVLAPPEGRAGLAALSDGPVPIHPLRDRILETLGEKYQSWKQNGFSALREEWLAQAYALNEKITARFARDQVEGVFRGVDDRGALLLETEPGRVRTIASAEILSN